VNRLRPLAPLALALLIITPLLTSCGNKGKDSKSNTTITISGAFALYPMVVTWSEEYHKLQPDVQFDVSAGGAGKGMSDVLSGAVEIAMVSREVRAEETSQGALAFGVVKDAVVATVNAKNPLLDRLLATGLTPETAAKIWMTQEITTWGGLLGTDDTTQIHVYTRADACGAAEVWALFLGGKAQEDLKGTAVQGDPGVAEAVRQDTLGIGFNNIGFAYDPSTGAAVEGLRVVPIDLNGDGKITSDEDFYAEKSGVAAAVADGRYPSPPARPLYLVTKGQPNAASTAFLRWVLTDGQAMVDAAGYVKLTDETLQASLGKLGQ
jgi:phosphate transport system substrate-binding protein